MIEPTNICNLKCPLCPVGNNTLDRPKGMMTFKNFKRIIDELESSLTTLWLWNYGEPLLNKDIFKMIEYASQKGIRVSMCTNGHFINEERAEQLVRSGLNKINIALDGATEKIYIKYRRDGDFRQVIKGIALILKKRKELKASSPLLEVQFIIMRHNEHEIAKIQKMTKLMGVDRLTLKRAGIDKEDRNHFVPESEYLPSNEEYRRYTIKDGSLVWKYNKNENWCERPWVHSVINWDGSVCPCCYDPRGRYTFGNVFTDGGFKRIWNNEKYRKFRVQLLADKNKLRCCNGCPGTFMEQILFV